MVGTSMIQVSNDLNKDVYIYNRGCIGVNKTSLNLNYSLTHLGEWDTPGGMWDGKSPCEPGGVEVGWGKSKQYSCNCIFVGHLGSETVG